MNILITGGAGYIGSAAAKALLKAGHQVTVYDSLATGHREAVPEGAIFIHADLCDLLTLGMALRDENYETVMHFAALRYFNACGALPGSDEAHQPESHLIPYVLNVALGQADCAYIYGTDYPTPDGTCIRDYIHIADLIMELLLITDQPVLLGFFNPLGNLLARSA